MEDPSDAEHDALLAGLLDGTIDMPDFRRRIG
jgi:hypothetical protein